MKHLETHPKDPGFPNQVRNWLQSLPDKAFVEFFYEAVSHRITSDRPEWLGHFVLADAERVDGIWGVDFLGLPSAVYRTDDWGDDAPLCQSGDCVSCGSSVRSWVKRALCPVCGENVACT